MARSGFEALTSRVVEGLTGESLIGLSRESGFKLRSETEVTETLDTASGILAALSLP
jgi:hypothetical protein